MREEVEDRIMEGIKRVWPLTFILFILLLAFLTVLALFELRRGELSDS